MVELIVGGTLDLIAKDLQIPIRSAGLLITVFSLTFAISAPILLTATARIERKKLYLWSLGLFVLSNLLVVISSHFIILLVSRVFSAATGSLLTVLSLTLATHHSKPIYHGRVLGIISMGTSSSLVLGVPIGIFLGQNYGWRSPFLFVSLVSLLLLIIFSFTLTKVAPQPTIPLRKQLLTLKSDKMISAHLILLFAMTGHLTLYAYFTPFLTNVLKIEAQWLSLLYLIYGISAVIGGGIGGWSVDRFGAKRSMITILLSFSICLLLLPWGASHLLLFLPLLILWSGLSWSITPVHQNYLIQIAPKLTDIQLGLSNSALHGGIALGSAIGGWTMEVYSLEYNPWIGSIFVICGLASALYSLSRPSLPQEVRS
jgi:DHA1 family purine base/nucleoside efflux pump-like MFS transporter